MSCISFKDGEGVRIQRLDECGVPVTGAKGFLALDSCSVKSIEFTEQIEEADEAVKKGMKGQTCRKKKACSTLDYVEVKLTVNDLIPELEELLRANTATVKSGVATGNIVCANSCGKVALEAIFEVDQDGCAGGEESYLWALFNGLQDIQRNGGTLIDGSNFAEYTYVGKAYKNAAWVDKHSTWAAGANAACQFYSTDVKTVTEAPLPTFSCEFQDTPA